MLTFFRRGGVAQVLVGGVVIAIIIVFVLEFRAGRGPTAGLTAECAVEVHGGCVDAKEYFAAFNLVVPRGMESKDIRNMNLRQAVLEGLVERELLLHEAKSLHIGISEAEVDEQLFQGRAYVSLPIAHADRLSYQLGLCRRQQYAAGCDTGSDLMVRQLPVQSFETKRFDYKIYERTVRNTTNRGPREFKEMQERELIAARMRDLVRSRPQLPASEAFLLYERERSRAVIRTAQIKRDWFAKYVADTSTASVEQWAADNKEQVDEAWKSAKEGWTADCPLVSEILVELAPGAADEDKTLARDRIDQAKQRIDKGDNFQEVARQLSDGQNAVLGGDLGCLTEKSYGLGADELIAAVKALKAGQVSPVVESSRGLHLLKLDGTVPEPELEPVGRHFLARRLAVRFKADELAREFGNALIEKVKGGAKLEDAVQALVDEYLKRAPADKVGKKPLKKDEEPAALQAAERPRVEISAPFSIMSSPLSNVESDATVAAKAFQLQKPDDIHPAPIETVDGIAVIQLKEKELATREQFEKDRQNLMRNLRQAKANDALARHLARLRKEAGEKVKINPRFTEEAKSESDDKG